MSYESFTNLSNVISKLGRLPDEIKNKLASGMAKEGEEIITASKERTPVDTGALRASEFQKTDIEGDVVKTTVGAGGSAAPYAVIVHEDLEAHHTVGQAKYLESAVQDQINSGMEDRLIDRIMDAAKDLGLK